MPAVTSGKVLVTGVNGYVAYWIVQSLLDKGYSVRGTVRSEAKGKHLRNLFASYSDRLELVVVEDFIKEGAFDTAVQGVDAIEHVASPVTWAAHDPDEVIKPAVEGTLGILRSAAKSDQIKRVVITSSIAAVMGLDVPPSPRTYSEKDWNRKAVEEVETKGFDSTAFDKYAASKTLAELAAWEFYERQKSEGAITFDLITIVPQYVFGPWLHDIKEPYSLNIPNNFFYEVIMEGKADENKLINEGGHWVDVRDLALAHVLSLENGAAGGQRLIINAGNWKWQDLVNAARKVSSKVSAGSESYRAETADHRVTLDTSKATEVLPQLQYRSLDDTVFATLESIEKAGWWTH